MEGRLPADQLHSHQERSEVWGVPEALWICQMVQGIKEWVYQCPQALCLCWSSVCAQQVGTEVLSPCEGK